MNSSSDMISSCNNEETSLLHDTERNDVDIIGKKCNGVIATVTNVFHDFKNFINRGSVLDLAVGIVIGEAFSSVVGSFVSDIFTPIIGLIVSSKLSEKFAVIKKGPHFPYKTRDEAKSDGAVTWNYGNFIQLIINFMCISTCLYLVIRMSKAMHKKRISSQTTKECTFCYSEIDGRARKCSHCGSTLMETTFTTFPPP
jgi:large conductance mechanosensitive channel